MNNETYRTLNLSRRLLLESTLTEKQIASKFSEEFKREFHITPSKFRKCCQKLSF